MRRVHFGICELGQLSSAVLYDGAAAFHRVLGQNLEQCKLHYDDVTMGAMAAQITSLAIVYSTFFSGADQSKHQSSASLAIVWGIHRGPVNSPHKWPVTRKMFPFDDVIMVCGLLNRAYTQPPMAQQVSFWIVMMTLLLPNYMSWSTVALTIQLIQMCVLNCQSNHQPNLTFWQQECDQASITFLNVDL